MVNKSTVIRKVTPVKFVFTTVKQPKTYYKVNNFYLSKVKIYHGKKSYHSKIQKLP
jgi:hypothetical protein